MTQSMLVAVGFVLCALSDNTILQILEAQPWCRCGGRGTDAGEEMRDNSLCAHHLYQLLLKDSRENLGWKLVMLVIFSGYK